MQQLLFGVGGGGFGGVVLAMLLSNLKSRARAAGTLLCIGEPMRSLCGLSVKVNNVFTITFS